uniref:KxDL motif-containing protein 1 n=2 Tax=Serinus canaria TaxID=9135 RepID=A0A8C9NBB9_SERCA
MSPTPALPVTPEVTMEPTASQVFCGRVLGMVNAEDVNAIILAQKNMLDRFEKTNEMLLNFNNLSSVRMQQMSERFLHHTRTLVEMKKDLDSIFRRIRTLKGKLAKQYPEAFSNIHESPILEDDDDFDPVPKSTTTTIATSEQSTESCDRAPMSSPPPPARILRIYPKASATARPSMDRVSQMRTRPTWTRRSPVLPLQNFLACIYICVLLFWAFFGFFFFLSWEEGSQGWEKLREEGAAPAASKVPLRCKATLALGGISKSWVGNASCPPSFLHSGEQLDFTLPVDFLVQKSVFGAQVFVFCKKCCL